MTSFFRLRPVKLIFTLIGVFSCVAMVVYSARLGLSRIFLKFALLTNNPVAANEAVRLATSDAETHYAHAVLLKSAGLVSESVVEFERAAALRPGDYVLWLELGMAREEANDFNGALLAMDESVRLAPYYGIPRWQRGNFLLRLQRFDDGFADLRAATLSSPELVPNLIDLAWGFSQSNSLVAQELADLRTPESHLAFAIYLARRNRAADALQQWKLSGEVPDEKRAELVATLLQQNAYAEAYEVWSDARGRVSAGAIYEGSFEGELTLSDTGFGWRLPKELRGIQLSNDATIAKDGTKSLRAEFTGESDPQLPVLSQLIVVSPDQSYELQFLSRGEKLVTGGLPVITVSDATTKNGIVSSEPFGDSANWQVHKVSFTTSTSTKAIIIALQRRACSTSPCPAFGTLWLDNFNLAVVNDVR